MSKVEITETQFDFYLDNIAECLGQNEGGWTFRTYSGNVVSQILNGSGSGYKYFLILL